MKKELKEFIKILKEKDRIKAINYIDEQIEKGTSIVEIYEKILAPSLYLVGEDIENEQLKIWEEHVISSIVRTIVEYLYPIVDNKKAATINKKALILCPSEEFHDLGARMVNDFLTLLGFETIFIGSNTPLSDFIYSIEITKPDLVAISVTNYYNLVTLKKTIEEVRKLNHKFKIVVGGSAFINNCHLETGADYCAATYSDLEKIKGDIC